MTLFYKAWDFKYTDYDYYKPEGLLVWEQHKFFNLQLNFRLKYDEINKEPWFYLPTKGKYDGVPFKACRIGFVRIVWGESGSWGGVDLIRKLDEFNRGIK